MITLQTLLIVISIVSIFLGGYFYSQIWSYGSNLKLWWLPNQIVNEWLEEKRIYNNTLHFIIDIWMNIILLPAMLIVLILHLITFGFLYSFCFFIWLVNKKR
jgi:hypothetical protein